MTKSHLLEDDRGRVKVSSERIELQTGFVSWIVEATAKQPTAVTVFQPPNAREVIEAAACLGLKVEYFHILPDWHVGFALTSTSYYEAGNYKYIAQ